MGLPNASLSQARRIEVFTWQDGGRPLYCYLDADEIICSGMMECHGLAADACQRMLQTSAA